MTIRDPRKQSIDVTKFERQLWALLPTWPPRRWQYSKPSANQLRDLLRAALKNKITRAQRQHWTYNRARHTALIRLFQTLQNLRDPRGSNHNDQSI